VSGFCRAEAILIPEKYKDIVASALQNPLMRYAQITWGKKYMLLKSIVGI